MVLEELRKVTSHPTATELHEMARRRMPQISLGTVYRNLKLLVQLGLVRKLETVGAEARFDGNTGEHHHVRCVQCGRVGDAHGLPDNPLRCDVQDIAGYEILGYSLELIGICRACRSGETESGEDLGLPEAG